MLMWPGEGWRAVPHRCRPRYSTGGGKLDRLLWEAAHRSGAKSAIRVGACNADNSSGKARLVRAQCDGDERTRLPSLLRVANLRKPVPANNGFAQAVLRMDLQRASPAGGPTPNRRYRRNSTILCKMLTCLLAPSKLNAKTSTGSVVVERISASGRNRRYSRNHRGHARSRGPSI